MLFLLCPLSVNYHHELLLLYLLLLLLYYYYTSTYSLQHVLLLLPSYDEPLSYFISMNKVESRVSFLLLTSSFFLHHHVM